MEQQLVVFTLADENYAVDIATVEGIIKLQPITTVPHAPYFVEGITNLRGKILAVIDLRKRFGMPAVKASKDSRIVVVEMNGVTVGMIVDAVTEVLRVSSECIEPPSPIVTKVESAFIQGIAKFDERLIILLNLGRLLTIEEQNSLQTVASVA
jgi:purine-binding chemotaxis protein CheW